MRPLLEIIVFASVVFVESVWQKPAFCGQYECPEYKVVQHGNGFEKRNYAAATWVYTSAAGKHSDASAATYFKLKQYLNRNNEAEKEISMATPVVTMMFPTTGLDVLKNFSQFFFIPSSAGPAPQPIDKSIRIEEVPRKDMYIREIKGQVSTVADWVKQANELAKAINDTSMYYPSFFFTAAYNPPFATGQKHNEVWFYAIRGHNAPLDIGLPHKLIKS